MMRSKHPDKDLEALLRALASSGWRIEKGRKYFKGYCPCGDHKKTDALSVEPHLIDPDVGADLRHGWVDVCTTIEGENEASALRAGLIAVRSAAHHAGAATPGWEADLDKVRATVQPAELVAPS